MRGVLASSGSLETVLSDAITTAPGTDDADARAEVERAEAALADTDAEEDAPGAE